MGGFKFKAETRPPGVSDRTETMWVVRAADEKAARAAVQPNVTPPPFGRLILMHALTESECEALRLEPGQARQLEPARDIPGICE